MKHKHGGIKVNSQGFKDIVLNDITYLDYFKRFLDISLSLFEWDNLPDTIDERFIEMCLFYDGKVFFFKDETIGYLCARGSMGGALDFYNIPKTRNAIAVNGYHRTLNDSDSVIIFNNYSHTPCAVDVMNYARRLYDIDRTIDVNAMAQKTPVLLQCDEKQKLTLENVYNQYSGNAPVIFGKRDLDSKGLSVLKTDAPFLGLQLAELRSNIWNECMTYLGIPNISVEKKERLITDEVVRSQGGTIACRNSKLRARKKAVEQINKMYNLNIDVHFSSDYE